MTEAEIRQSLSTVNIAIAQLIEGQKILELRVGSGNFVRLFRYGEVTLDALREYRNELLGMLASITSNTPTYRPHTTIPLIVKKERSHD